MPSRSYPRWQRRHEGILLWLLQNPAGTLKQCARATGYSPSQVSRITCAPDFRARYTAALKALQRVAYFEKFSGSMGVAGQGNPDP